MKHCIISFSFDDARWDSYRAIQLALKYHIKSTLNVTTRYVSGELEHDKCPCALPPMTVDSVKELHNLGVEMACHGAEHNNELANILAGKKELQQWLHMDEQQKIGFASPHSGLELSPHNLSVLSKHFTYVRMGPYLQKPPLFHKVCRKIARSTKSVIAFEKAFLDIITHPQEGLLLRSVPVMRENSFEQIKFLIDNHAQEHCLIILMFHSVLQREEAGYLDPFSWDWHEYIKLCQYISANKMVCPLPTQEAIQLYQQRPGEKYA